MFNRWGRITFGVGIASWLLWFLFVWLHIAFNNPAPDITAERAARAQETLQDLIDLLVPVMGFSTAGAFFWYIGWALRLAFGSSAPPHSVTPAKAGVQPSQQSWTDARLRGHDDGGTIMSRLPTKGGPSSDPKSDSSMAMAIVLLLFFGIVVGLYAGGGVEPGKTVSVSSFSPSPPTSAQAPRFETAAIPLSKVSEPRPKPDIPSRVNVQFEHRFACRDQSKLRILLNLYDPDKPKRWVRPLTAAIDDGSCTYVRDAHYLAVLERAEPGIARVHGTGLGDGMWWTAAEVVSD